METVLRMRSSVILSVAPITLAAQLVPALIPALRKKASPASDKGRNRPPSNARGRVPNSFRHASQKRTPSSNEKKNVQNRKKEPLRRAMHTSSQGKGRSHSHRTASSQVSYFTYEIKARINGGKRGEGALRSAARNQPVGIKAIPPCRK